MKNTLYYIQVSKQGLLVSYIKRIYKQIEAALEGPHVNKTPPIIQLDMKGISKGKQNAITFKTRKFKLRAERVVGVAVERIRGHEGGAGRSGFCVWKAKQLGINKR